MDFDPAFTPDQQSSGFDPAFTPDAAPAAVPAPPTAPVQYNMANANRGIVTPVAPPAPPAADEPTFAATDLAPGDAAPDAAARMQDASVPLNPADVAAVRNAQDAAVAAKVAAVRTALGGAPFDASSGVDSAWQRARMGIMANPEDRAKYLQDNMPPNTDIKVLNAPGIGRMVVFKPPGATSYQPIKGVNDTAGRVGDILAATPSVATQIGTGVATDGESLLWRLAAQGATGTAERAVELGANKAQGYDDRSLWKDAGDAATHGAVNSGAEALGSAFANAIGKGGGAFTMPAEGLERTEAQKTLQQFNPDVPNLTAFQMGHPILESKGQRLAAVNPTIANKAVEQASGLGDTMAKSVAAATGGGAPAIGDTSVNVGNVVYPGLSDIVQGLKDKAAAPLQNISPVSPTAGGRAFQQGALDIKDRLAARTSDKFDAALEAARNAPDAPNGVVPFDLTATHNTIDDLSQPVIGQGVPKEVTTETPIEGTGGLGEPVQLGTKTETSVQPTEQPVGTGMSPQIKAVVDQLRGLNPTLGVGPMTERTDAPYDALKVARSALSNASVYNPNADAAARQAAGQAQRILEPLNEALVNPGEGAPADFVPKMQAAQNAGKFQGKVLDNPDMQGAMHTPYPEDNMALADPTNATFLKTAQRLMDPVQYQKFQDAYATAAIRQPEKLQGLLDSYRSDPSVLNRLISPQNQGLLKQYGIDMGNVEGSLPNKLLQEPDFNARARMAFENSSSKDLQGLIAQGGGINSPTGQNLRGALFQNVLDNSMNDEGKIDMGKAVKAVSSLMSDGRAAAVLSPDELTRLDAMRTYAAGGDTLSKGLGSSIYASETAGKLGPLVALSRPREFLHALAELAEAHIQSSTWGSKGGARFLFGQPGGSPPLYARLPATAGSAYEMNQKQQEPTVGR